MAAGHALGATGHRRQCPLHDRVDRVAGSRGTVRLVGYGLARGHAHLEQDIFLVGEVEVEGALGDASARAISSTVVGLRHRSRSRASLQQRDRRVRPGPGGCGGTVPGPARNGGARRSRSSGCFRVWSSQASGRSLGKGLILNQLAAMPESVASTSRSSHARSNNARAASEFEAGSSGHHHPHGRTSRPCRSPVWGQPALTPSNSSSTSSLSREGISRSQAANEGSRSRRRPW